MNRSDSCLGNGQSFGRNNKVSNKKKFYEKKNVYPQNYFSVFLWETIVFFSRELRAVSGREMAVWEKGREQGCEAAACEEVA